MTCLDLKTNVLSVNKTDHVLHSCKLLPEIRKIEV